MSENNDKSLSQIPGFHHFDLGEFVVRSIQNDPTLQPSTKHQYTKAIENGVRAEPDQWFWVHQRWKTKPFSPWPRQERSS